MNREDRTFRWKKHLPTKEELLLVFKSFSKKERVIFFSVFAFFTVASIMFLSTINGLISVRMPAHGGEISEGIIGTPRFVNPVLAISDSDRDLTFLVYSGLMKKEPNGDIVPDLAEKYEISDDGLSYIFVIRDGAVFHDKTPVTADDVEFTIGRIKDPFVKSPRRANWEGVSVQKINDKTIKFTLKQKYFPFLETATLGIIPKHSWKDLTPEQFNFSDLNVYGIGSGPYSISSVTKNSSGIPASYELKSFPDYAMGEPFVDKIILRFYPNETELITAFDNGIVDNINSIDPGKASILKESGYSVLKSPLPRVFAVFFNQNKNQVFADAAVRKALEHAADKERIIREVLYGYGTAINAPIPEINIPTKNSKESRAEEAKKILENAGWSFNEAEGVMEKKIKKEVTRLSFSLDTGDAPELKETAERLKEDWEKIGAKVELKVFEIGDLNQNIIRPRKYDALFFGEIVGFGSDPYPFWHSSQRNDPGPNIALYTNTKADKILEELRGILDGGKRAEKYREFGVEIEKDSPAVFVYSPDFIYLADKNVGGIELGNITEPKDRFLGVRNWYLSTENVWKIFSRWAERK
ncbi:MAG: ABC transporter substrate-binding protein [Patescibacteria group bacterium]